MKLLLAAALAALATAAAADPVRVSTKAGVVVGEVADGVKVFKGVSYAQPPVGPLRWTGPKPVAWKGERLATAFTPPCLQPDGANGRPNGRGHAGPSSEDCLYLNVWAPAVAKPAPIMLWLHGGGGTMGGGHLATYHGCDPGLFALGRVTRAARRREMMCDQLKLGFVRDLFGT